METNVEELFARGIETLKSPCNSLILLAASNKNVISTISGNTLISIQPYDIWGQLTRKIV